AAVHSLEYRPDAVLVARLAHDRLADAEQRPDAAVAEALALQRAQPLGLQRVEAFRGDGLLRLDEILDLREEPRIDLRELMDLVERHAETERVRDVPEPVGARHAELALELGPFLLGLRRAHHRRESVDADLEAAQRLLQRLLERPPDRHDLADRFHLRGQAIVRLRKLLEREARYLRDDVIDRRLEARGREPARDLVAQLVEGVADRELRRDFRDRESGRLRRERGRARHARIHLDDDEPPVLGVDRELHVRAAGVDADLAQHGDRRVAHALILLVGQRLGGRDGDRVARLDAHRVEVLDGADDDAVVVPNATSLHLALMPAEHRLLAHHLGRRPLVEAARDDLLELLAVVRDTAAASAERERRAPDDREADLLLHLPRFLERMRHTGARDLDRKSTRLNSSHVKISYAVFCLKKNRYPSSSSRS